MKNTGFSLVELIVVIAIMAVLAGVAVPVYSHFVEDSKKGKDNDYVAEVYRLACLEAASEGLEVEKVVVALEDDGNENTADFKGKLAMVIFQGQEADQDTDYDAAEKKVIEAVWAKMDAHEFSYSTYLEWAEEDGVQGVYYNRESSDLGPYTIARQSSGVELPAIPL